MRRFILAKKGSEAMFREMRRKNQALTKEECQAILQHGSSGVLALAGDAGYPYAVPMSYLFDEGKIWFHCAKSGHKLDAIAQNGKASFCVIEEDKVAPREYTTYFRSVIVFGQMRILHDEGEKRRAIEKLASKYAPGESEAERQQAIQKEYSALCMLELTIQHISGKEATELARRKRAHQ